MKRLLRKEKISSTVEIPGSKSITHRAMIISALAIGNSTIQNPLLCEDTLYTLNALRQLGVRINLSHIKNEIYVSGTGGRFPHISEIRKIFVGNSGTSYRLLLPIAGLARGRFLFTGHSRMKQRPIGELVTSMMRLGISIRYLEKEGFPPVLINGRGHIDGGSVEISGDQSSQFISSILLSSPYAEKDVKINIRGKLVSRSYIDLTIDMMNRFGISVDRDGYNQFWIPAGKRYRASHLMVEGDISNASYFWAAAAVTGGSITTRHIYPHITSQGDISFLDILQDMGCTVIKGDNSVTVRGGVLKGIDVEMSAMPDMVPTLSAIALFAEGRTFIRNIRHLRYKESDRLKAIEDELTRLGAHVEALEDGLIIHGGNVLTGTVVDPHNDHRIAMSLAIVGLKVQGIILKNPSCVNKSFPTFWDLWDRL